MKFGSGWGLDPESTELLMTCYDGKQDIRSVSQSVGE